MSESRKNKPLVLAGGWKPAPREGGFSAKLGGDSRQWWFEECPAVEEVGTSFLRAAQFEQRLGDWYSLWSRTGARLQAMTRRQGWGRKGRPDREGGARAQVCGGLLMKEEDTG